MSNTPDNVDTAKPARMIRKQVRITIEQNQQMKRIAATMGRTEADLLREAVAEKLAVLAAKQPASDDWRAKMRAALVGPPLDQDFEVRVRNTKASQAAAWEQRLTATRRALDQK
jgi:hypothetical protein